MKTLLLTFLSLSFLSAATAQRTLDLAVSLSSPADGSEIHPQQTFNLEINIANAGQEALLASDSLALYLIMNGDTIPQMDGNYWLHTNLPIAAQGMQTINKTMAFDNSFLGAHVDLCVFARPFNHSDPVSDNLPANNTGCAGVDVLEAVNGLNENLAESISVYPNPVGDHFSVTGAGITSVTITDNAGKTVLEQIAGLTEIDCSSLMNGIYFARITTSKGEYVRKITVGK